MVASGTIRIINQYGHAAERQSGVQGVTWNSTYEVWEAKVLLGGKQKLKRFNPRWYMTSEDKSHLDEGPLKRALEQAIAHRKWMEKQYFEVVITPTPAPPTY